MNLSLLRFYALASSLVFTLALSTGCGDSFSVGPDGKDVGGECENDDDCGPDSFCITNDEDFPGGTCSIECSSHEDCPEGTRCISTNGGVCALECNSEDDCRDGYGCESKSDEQGDGESMVCID
jgi:hypothetical protein